MLCQVKFTLINFSVTLYTTSVAWGKVLLKFSNPLKSGLAVLLAKEVLINVRANRAIMDNLFIIMVLKFLFLFCLFSKWAWNGYFFPGCRPAFIERAPLFRPKAHH